MLALLTQFTTALVCHDESSKMPLQISLRRRISSLGDLVQNERIAERHVPISHSNFFELHM